MNEDSTRPADVSHRLAERIKELTALRQTVEILADRAASTADLLHRIAVLLPPAFQFPDVAEACVCHAGTIAATPGYGDHHAKLVSGFHTRDRAAGRVEVVYREPRPSADEGPFLAEERHLLDAIAEMLTSALDHRSAEERLRLLLRVTNVVTAELDMEVLLRTISKLLADVGHRLASIVLWDPQEGVLRRHALVSADGTKVVHSPRVMLHDDAPALKTFRTKNTQVYQWPDVEALGEEATGLMTQLGLRSLCTVPLKTPRDCHGVLMVGRPNDAPYSAADVALLEQVAHPLAIAIENALAYRRISDLRDRLVDEKVYLLRFLCVCACATVLGAQPGNTRSSVDAPPGRWTAYGVSLRSIITQAFQIQDYQLVDAPSWIDNAFFDINARLPEGTFTREQRGVRRACRGSSPQRSRARTRRRASATVTRQRHGARRRLRQVRRWRPW